MIPAILHMGLPKTGSTSVQAFFNRNRDLLQTNGILYPKSLGLKAHVKLLALAGHTEYKKFDPKYSPKSKEKIRNAAMRDFRQELQDNSVQRVILSCENMPRASSATFQQLRDSLEDCGVRVDEVLLYLRPQAEWRRSVIQQRIKVGVWDDETVYPVDEPESCGKYGCYRDHVERRAEAFGMETIKLRLFGPEYFKDGDFHSEIREAFDLQEAPYELAPPSNESLSDFACYMLMYLNKALPRYKVNGEECPRRLHIRRAAAKYFTAPAKSGTGKVALPVDIVAKYENYYEESNEWIRQRFFPERKRLFNPKTPLPESPEIPLEVVHRAKTAAQEILALRKKSEIGKYFSALNSQLIETPVLQSPKPLTKVPLTNTKKVSDYLSRNYWGRRSSMLYYRYVEAIIGELGAEARSMLDVGSGNCPYLDWFDWIPERVSVDIRAPYQSANVKSITGDIFKLEFPQPFDLCLCLQVLEHIRDAGAFARRLLELGRIVVVSVPYKWPNKPRPKPATHIHDPVDYAKLTRWMGREADYKIIVEEPLSKSPRRRRLIAVYNSDPT